MHQDLLAKDKEFLAISKFFDISSDKEEQVRREFERAFLKWYKIKGRLDEQIKDLKRLQINYNSKDYYSTMVRLQENKQDITCSIGKICTVINQIIPGNPEIDETVVKILKAVVNKRNKIAENILEGGAWTNERNAMLAMIEAKPSAINIIGTKLSNDFEFMTYIIYMFVGTSNQWRVYRKIGDTLKYNVDFLVLILKILVEKYSEKGECYKLKDDFYKCLKNIYDVPFNENTYILQNKRILKEIRDLKIDQYVESPLLDSVIAKVLFSNDTDWIKKYGTVERRAAFISEDVENITEYQRDDYVLMIGLIKINVDFYTFASERLKVKESFQNDSLELGVPKEVIDSEMNKIIQERKKNRDKISEGIKNKKEEKEAEVRKRYSPESSEYLFVEQYLNSDDTISVFCSNNGLNDNYFRETLEKITSLYPDLSIKRQEKISKATEKRKEKVNQFVSKLMADKENFFNFAKNKKSNIKISDLMEYVKDKKEFANFIINMITTQRLTMNDYVRLFSLEDDYLKTIKRIQKFIKEAEKLCPELEGLGNPIYLARYEIGLLNKYETKFERSYFVGHKFGTVTELVEITDERMDFILDYLNNKDEFICYNTVSEAINILMDEWIA